MPHAIGVDIGGTTTKIARIGADGTVSDLTTLPTAGPPESFLEAIVNEIVRRSSDQPYAGVGIAVAGFVSKDHSAMVYNPNIEWLQGFPLQHLLAQGTGMRVLLEADSNAACVGEQRFGVGLGATRFLCLTIGTGVGGGMTVDGELVRLAHEGLGDIGHVIVDPFGAACDSGCYGCAEGSISAAAIKRRYGHATSLREMVEQARNGQERAVDALSETGRLLGVALASYSVILFPDVIAIAGGVGESGELLLAPARASLNQLTGSFYRRELRVEKAALGWLAPLVGAAVPLFDTHA